MRATDPSVRGRFLAKLSFELDPFQTEALDAVDQGRSVLVCAPTGSGKTLVATYAVHRSLSRGVKAFYTTPLKALSNQKFVELTASHGSGEVGLLTGDTSVNPSARVVVMTTEVLRNMLFAGSDLLEGLGTVVLDEVHYLQDPYRGAVWEEVLILCPAEVRFICLSATVANPTELGTWLRSVRGPTEVIVERHRPITLRQHLAVHRRGDSEPVLLPLLSGGKADDESLKLDYTVQKALRSQTPQWRGSRGRGGPLLPLRSPRRADLILTLDEAGLLPGIVFIFSRASCDEAVRQCLREGLRLTERSERQRIRRIAESHVEDLSDEDLRVLGFAEWLEGLQAGIAAHHAGMVPAFREAVEECFSAGHLKIVFATETLSLGINMPARTVVIERFTKFGGSGRSPLTAGEYAQLIGRAGRRGLDAEGHAVVAWSAETPVSEVARIALAAPPDLRSAFRPTYNLAVNLIHRHDRAGAVELLGRSFAQWQVTEKGSARSSPSMADLFARRLAVLEELSYVSGWSLSERGLRLARLYHASDLLVAEAIHDGVLEGAEPSVLAGVVSAFVFERRRARRVLARHDPPSAHKGARRGGRIAKPLGNRLGEGRLSDVRDRLARLEELAIGVRGLEEIHHVPRTRQPEGGLAAAITSWARGVPLGTALDVAAVDSGEVAPGDFVRTVKEVADLSGQISLVAAEDTTAAAARLVIPQLMRGVVSAQGLAAADTLGQASASFDAARF